MQTYFAPIRLNIKEELALPSKNKKITQNMKKRNQDTIKKNQTYQQTGKKLHFQANLKADFQYVPLFLTNKKKYEKGK